MSIDAERQRLLCAWGLRVDYDVKDIQTNNLVKHFNMKIPLHKLYQCFEIYSDFLNNIIMQIFKVLIDDNFDRLILVVEVDMFTF